MQHIQTSIIDIITMTPMVMIEMIKNASLCGGTGVGAVGVPVVGMLVGAIDVGAPVGVADVGDALGVADVGAPVGTTVVGDADGATLGAELGATVGVVVGVADDGAAVVGDTVVGASVTRHPSGAVRHDCGVPTGNISMSPKYSYATSPVSISLLVSHKHMPLLDAVSAHLYPLNPISSAMKYVGVRPAAHVLDSHSDCM